MTKHAAVTLLALALLFPALGAAAGPDPWDVLVQARTHMQEQGPRLLSFTQTYLPTGFDRGEQETGRVALDLPRCVRWDYDQPYPKSFLLCGDKLWSWNPGEPAGHLYDLDQAQPGLDLLLLATKDLAERYDAKAQAAGGATRVQLAPKVSGPNVLKDAALLVEKDGTVRELTYRDAEGNRTTFRFANARALTETGIFTPPEGVRWEHEGARSGGG
jgi:outer membrane lipoprotein carrier protein